MISSCQIAGCGRPAVAELGPATVCDECNTEQAAAAIAEGGNAGRYIYNDKPVVLPCKGDPPWEPFEKAEPGPLLPHRVSGGAMPGSAGSADSVDPHEIGQVYNAAPWAPYWLPCFICREEFVYDPENRGGIIFCDSCDDEWETINKRRPPPPKPEPAPAPAPSSAPRVALESGESNDPKNDTASFDRAHPPWYPAVPFWETLRDRMATAAYEAYEERAAIMEYHGELPRFEAEQRSYQIQLEKARRANLL